MTITIQTMIPPRGSTDWSAGRENNFQYLCIGAIYPYQPIDVVYSQKTGFIHVTGVPDTLNIQKLKEYLETSQEVINPETGESEIVEKRDCVLDIGAFNNKELRDLATDRQITIQATKLVNNLKRRGVLETVDLNSFLT